MPEPLLQPLPGGAAAVWTGRSQGDLGLTADRGVDARRRAVVDRPWSFLHQVHGSDCLVVGAPGERVGVDGDALVSASGDTALAVFTADCAPLALASPEGVFAAVHAGWRGLLAGVVENAVAQMRVLGAGTVSGALGPCIRAECYEFSPADLDRIAGRLGAAVRAVTSDGRPALDVAAAVASAVSSAGAELIADSGVCTACSDEHYSHRARAEPQRQALVVWRP